MIEHLSSDSKIWIYDCHRQINREEKELIAEDLKSFCSRWTAHNQSLKAGFTIDFNRFIILAVDETQNNASGCSIDKSVNYLKELAQKYNLDLFSRLEMVYLEENQLKTVHYAQIKSSFERGDFSINTLFFNTQIEKLQELKTDFLIPLQQHWLNKQLKLNVNGRL